MYNSTIAIYSDIFIVIYTFSVHTSVPFTEGLTYPVSPVETEELFWVEFVPHIGDMTIPPYWAFLR